MLYVHQCWTGYTSCSSLGESGEVVGKQLEMHDSVQIERCNLQVMTQPPGLTAVGSKEFTAGQEEYSEPVMFNMSRHQLETQKHQM